MTPARRSGSAPGTEAVPEAALTANRWSREWIYFAFVVAAWTFTPLIRRLIDFKNGAFNPVPVASLVPFLLLIPFALFCFRGDRMQRLAPALRALVYVWIATFAYGFMLAAAFGSVGAGAFELLQYALPMLAGVWLAGQELDAAESMKRLAIILFPCAAVVAAYGIAQWVQPLPWDVLWVEGSQFKGADQPVPFGMRIFSTLNSPGTAADYFALVMLFALPFLRARNAWAWPLLAALAGALMLTLTREAWVAYVVGTCVYLLASPARLRALPMLALFGAVLAILVGTLPVLLGSGANADVVSSRISTFADVGHDASALARQTEISNALAQGLSNPLGSGLGNLGAAARLSSNAQTDLGSVLDSGYLARFVEMGWLGFAGYLAVVIGAPVVILSGLLKRKPVAAGGAVYVAGATAVAMAFALAWGDAASDAHLGLEGLFFWMAIGLGSLAIVPATARVPNLAPAVGRRMYSRLGRSL